MIKHLLLLGIALVGLTASCNHPSPEPEPAPTPVPSGLARGADVSWLTQMEQEGCRFFSNQGVETDCLVLLKTLGVNAVRLRVWVDPEGGWCGTKDVVDKARRAAALDLAVMIDFHYSDSWADPGKQNKPAAWKDLSFPALQQAVYDHTAEVLTALRDAGITPAWIQIGNETTGGMLWPDGQNYNDVGFSQYVQLHNMGYTAAKEVFPEAIVLIHVDNGQKSDTLNWFFENCAKFGARYDMIGLSLYPESTNWRQYVQQLILNVNNLYLKYDKECMLCEVGMNWTESAECNSFLSALLASAQPAGEMQGHCHGVFYWEPEGYHAWSGYSKAAFDNNGRPTQALLAFSN